MLEQAACHFAPRLFARFRDAFVTMVEARRINEANCLGEYGVAVNTKNPGDAERELHISRVIADA